VVDADGATIAALRGDGTGVHTLDSAHDKAYTAVSFKNDTLALAERAKGEDSIAPLAKLPHVMFFGGGVIKIADETVGAIGAAGAPGAKLDDGCARAGLEKIRDRLNKGFAAQRVGGVTGVTVEALDMCQSRCIDRRTPTRMRSGRASLISKTGIGDGPSVHRAGAG
jgi:uncharacterized protein GlcG (DUF336 family)